MSFKSNGQRNVLVFRTGQLGDTIVSLPAIHAIRAGYPDHKLILLTPVQPRNLVSPLEILGATKIFSQILFYVPPFDSPFAWVRSLALAIKIRQLKPDVFFYLRGLPWNHFWRDRFFFRILSGIPKTYGLGGSEGIVSHRDESGRLCRCPSEVERLLRIVAEAGRDIPPPGEVDFGILVPDAAVRRVDSVWRQAGIRQDDLPIAFGPGSKMLAKRWPLERFKEVGRSLLSGFRETRLVIFGGAEDSALGEKLQETLGERVVNLAGSLSVLESAEGLRRCSLYVGNDTGVMHLAAAMGTPCVAIFSARDHPGRWDPYGPDHIVLRKDPDCAGCFLEVCGEHNMICLTNIHINEVLKSVHNILARERSGAGQCVELQESLR